MTAADAATIAALYAAQQRRHASPDHDGAIVALVRAADGVWRDPRSVRRTA